MSQFNALEIIVLSACFAPWVGIGAWIVYVSIKYRHR